MIYLKVQPRNLKVKLSGTQILCPKRTMQLQLKNSEFLNKAKCFDNNNLNSYSYLFMPKCQKHLKIVSGV